MIAVIAAGVAVLALLYVAYPLLRADRRRATSEPEPRGDLMPAARLEDLLARQRATYETLRELALDHRLGALDAATYERHRARYERRALALLKALDAWEAEADASLTGRLLTRQKPSRPTTSGRLEQSPSARDR